MPARSRVVVGGVTAMAAALLPLIAPAMAEAGFGDVFGLGPQVMGLGGAGSALGTGPWAAHNCPAMLAFAQRGSLSVGVAGLDSALEIGGSAMPIEDPVGILAGVSTVRKLENPVFTAVGIGLAAWVLPGAAAHVLQHTPETPFFLAFDNRTQRDMLLPAIAVKLGKHLALGLGLDVFAGIEASIVSRQSHAGDVESSVLGRFFTTIRPTPSVVVRPGGGFTLALVYHPQFSVPYSIAWDAYVSGLDIEIRADGRALLTPHTLVAGLAWEQEGGALAIALDVAWAMWSKLGDPFTRVETRLLEVGLLAVSNPHVAMKDTVSVRLGIEMRLVQAAAVALVLRVGAGWESPIVGPQSGRSNVMDGHKVTGALGLGTTWKTGSQAVPAVKLDLSAGIVAVGRLTHTKVISDPAAGRDDPSLIVDEDETVPGVQVTNPGYPSISGSGWVTTVGATITLEFE